MKALAVLFLATLAMGAAGCAGGDQNVIDVKDAAHFHMIMADANRPILMVYGKDGCALCGAMDPVMKRLGEEYAGRVTVGHYMLMTFVFIPRSREIMQKYDIGFFPTVVLYNKGKEVGRWLADYDVDKYRTAIDRLVPPDPNKPRKTPTTASQPAAKSQPASTTP